MQVDGVNVELGKVFIDDQLGAGQVTHIGVDSFAVKFDSTTSRTYFGDGLLAGRKMLRARRQFVVLPTADQEPVVIAFLNALHIKFVN
jgi:hypothetical protein